MEFRYALSSSFVKLDAERDTGKIYRSMTGIYVLGGRTPRTPGMYCAVDPETGESTGKPLRQTNEYIHPSARSRTVLKGLGVEDEGTYRSEALKDYRLRFIDEMAGQRPMAVWRSRKKSSRARELPER